MTRKSSPKGNNYGASDRDMERVLKEHFETESSDLRMSKDPWDWLESRMEEPESIPWLSRILNSLRNMFQLRPGPVFSAAGAAAVVLVAIFFTLNVLIDDDQGNPLNAMLPLEATPEDFERVERAWGRGTPAPAPTAAPVAAAPTMAPTPAPTMAPTPRPTPPRFAATAAPAMAPIPPADMAPTPQPSPTRQRFMPDVTPAATPAPTMAPAPRHTAALQGVTGGAAPATTFRDYARERFVSAAVDNVSTFSLDTDRTSYFLALNWARNGYDVDPDSVRAEEWINAFNYGYDQPRRDDSFNISTDVARHPSTAACTSPASPSRPPTLTTTPPQSTSPSSWTPQAPCLTTTAST